MQSRTLQALIDQRKKILMKSHAAQQQAQRRCDETARLCEQLSRLAPAPIAVGSRVSASGLRSSANFHARLQGALAAAKERGAELDKNLHQATQTCQARARAVQALATLANRRQAAAMNAELQREQGLCDEHAVLRHAR